jgi:glycosyltransferase involved in cell wall biosynthesis
MQCLGREHTVFAGVSNAVRDDLRASLNAFPAERIITLYNVIDIEQVEPTFLERTAARNALQLPADHFIFGNIARLAVNKDHASLITAFAIVHAKHPNTLLVLIGDGILEPAIRAQIATLHLEKHIILTGFLPCAFEKLKAFDAFVLASTQEAFGRVLIEAMLAHCPLIATRVNGIPEVVGDAGCLIPARDPEALATAMMAFIENKNQREQYSAAGYQRVSQQFSIPAFNQVFWDQPLLQWQKEEKIA